MHCCKRQEEPSFRSAPSWHSSQTGSQAPSPEPPATQPDQLVSPPEAYQSTQLLSPSPEKAPQPSQDVPSGPKKASPPDRGCSFKPQESSGADPGSSFKPQQSSRLFPQGPRKLRSRPRLFPQGPRKLRRNRLRQKPAPPKNLQKPDKSKDVAKNPTQPHKAGKQHDDEYVEPAEMHAPPPEQVSKKTLMKRLDRICTPKADGSYKVPMEIINSYKNLESREQVYRAFEKCGCEPDPLARLLCDSGILVTRMNLTPLLARASSRSE